MDTAKVFESGKSQAVRLPKKFRFSGDEVFIKKVGQAVLLVPKDALWQTFMEGVNGFSDDFMNTGRDEHIEINRESL